MKKILTAVIIAMAILPAALMASSAAGKQPTAPEDQILGTYFVSHEGEDSRVSVTRGDDGTYSAQVIWVRDSLDRKGNIRLDEKNPDKSLRKVPCNQIVLIWDMKYDAAKGRWSGGKIYDPTRGIRANAVCSFDPDGRLRVKGSLMGISQTVFWDKEN